MKSIAYLIPQFPVLSETFVGTEMRAMQRQGHRIVPIALERPKKQGQPQDQPLVEQTVYFDELSAKHAVKALVNSSSDYTKAIQFAFAQKGMSAKSLLFAAAKIAGFVKQQGCDHIHAHFAQSTAAFSIVAARLLGISVSFIGHGMDVYAYPADLEVKLAHTDFAAAGCHDLVKELQAIQNSAKVHLIMCGIELDRFAMPVKRHKHNGKLLFVGRLHETKGGNDLLSAIACIDIAKRPSIDFVGDGEEQENLVKQARDLGISHHVNFLGRKTSDWIAKHGHEYVALTVPFKPAANGDRDTGPVVVKEAMALGLPVVTTHFQGCKEMVSEQTGYRVPVGDVEALANAILELLSMPTSKWQAMGEAARLRVEELYTADIQALRLSELIEAA